MVVVVVGLFASVQLPRVCAFCVSRLRRRQCFVRGRSNLESLAGVRKEQFWGVRGVGGISFQTVTVRLIDIFDTKTT